MDVTRLYFDFLGGKKPAAKKGGLGAKKGLGATKATKNFAEIEAEAEMADKIATSRMEMKVQFFELQQKYSLNESFI